MLRSYGLSLSSFSVAILSEAPLKFSMFRSSIASFSTLPVAASIVGAGCLPSWSWPALCAQDTWNAASNSTATSSLDNDP